MHIIQMHLKHFFLSSLENYFENLVVFGCGGNRDKSKRSEMLKIAIKHASKVFTSDNSRDEKFDDIYERCIENNTLDNVIPIRDREKAIIHGSKR